MTTLEGNELLEFERLYEMGDYEASQGSLEDRQMASEHFGQAAELAGTFGDDKRLVEALNPQARNLWAIQHFDDAERALWRAVLVAGRNEWPDEHGIAYSNMGRLAAARCLDEDPDELREALADRAVPQFQIAHGLLEGHDHFYYRYANAQHGSVVAALAGDSAFARELIADGLSVAFRRSPPYDKRLTFAIKPVGLAQMGLAGALVAGGNHSGLLVGAAVQHLG